MSENQGNPPSAFRAMIGAKLDAIEDARARDRDEIALRFAVRFAGHDDPDLYTIGLRVERAYAWADAFLAERDRQNGGAK